MQAAHTSGSRSGITAGNVVASASSSPNFHWSKPQEPFLPEWEKWLQLSSVAMMAIQSTSFSEVTRSEVGQRALVIMGGLSEETTSKKVISMLFLVSGESARKTFG